MILKLNKKLKNIFHFVYKYSVIFLTLFEFPLFLLKNKKLFSAKIVYPFWNQSFGHQIMGFDYASRLYFPRRIAVIHIPHPRNNSKLSLCFTNLDYFCFKSVLFNQSHYWGKHAYVGVRFCLLIVSSLNTRMSVINQFNLYKTLSISTERQFVGGEDGKTLVPYPDTTGYMRLIRDSIGRKPRLNLQEISRVHRELKSVIPSFSEDRLICVLLRNKGGWRNTDLIRSSSPQENYLPSLEWLSRKKYFVICLGETSSGTFSNIDNIYFPKDFNIDYELLNLFCLTSSVGLICNQSGPYLLAESAGVPCLIVENVWPTYGSWNSNTLIANKKIDVGGRILTDQDLYGYASTAAFGLTHDDPKLVGLDSLQILKSVIVFIKKFTFRVKKYEYPIGSRIKSSNNPIISV